MRLEILARSPGRPNFSLAHLSCLCVPHARNTIQIFSYTAAGHTAPRCCLLSMHGAGCFTKMAMVMAMARDLRNLARSTVAAGLGPQPWYGNADNRKDENREHKQCTKWFDSSELGITIVNLNLSSSTPIQKPSTAQRRPLCSILIPRRAGIIEPYP